VSEVFLIGEYFANLQARAWLSLAPFARLANTPPILRSSIATNSVSTLSVSSEHTRLLLVVSCSFFLSYAPVRWIKLVKSQLSRARKVTAYRNVWLSVMKFGGGIQCNCITGLVFYAT